MKMKDAKYLDKAINLEDIVHVVCIEDIRNYVGKEVWEQNDGFVLATQDFTNYGNARVKEIADNFITKGYEIFDVKRYNKVVLNLKKEISKLLKVQKDLEKDLKQARHNVSKLQKKLNEEVKDNVC